MTDREQAKSSAPRNAKSSAPEKNAAQTARSLAKPRRGRPTSERAPTRRPADSNAQVALASRPIDDVCIDTIRTLSMDAVQKAESGHPGAPMALAPVMYTLWRQFLRYDPEDPTWLNRDRFILSNGHASMLLYATLHLAGVKAVNAAHEILDQPAVSLDDIKAFRQLDSRCPGHPEHHITTGVEATTGPLGQGCGMSVGMAMGERWLAQNFNRPGLKIVDYDVYAICSDGDMMEGVSNEAASLAGHLMLGNLCWIYDSNQVTIEGHTELAFSDDVAARFRAYGWNVQHVGDANDTRRMAEALKAFKASPDAPMLIIVESHIGYGAPHKHDTSAAHGEALGVEEVRLTKRAYGWPEESSFLVPDGVREHFHESSGRRGAPIVLTSRPIIADYGGGIGVIQDFNRLELTFRGSYERTYWQNAHFSDGSTQVLSLDSYDDYGLTARAAYEWTPGIKPFIQAGLDQRIHDSLYDTDGYMRNSLGDAVSAGSTFELTRLLTGALSAGYADRQYQDPRLANLRGPIFDASLVWTATPLTKVTLRGSTTLDETTVAGASGAITRQGGIEIAHALLRNLTLIAAGSWQNSTYPGAVPRIDQTLIQAGLRAEYSLTRSIVLKGSFITQRMASTAPGTDYTANIFMVGLKLQQ